MGIRTRLTPPLGLRGIYELELPYKALKGKIYKCEAIRSFSDIVGLEIAIFETFYEPYGVSFEVYKQDLDVNAHIVTLKSEADIIHLPDTFIKVIPYTGSDTYKQHILGIDLGPISSDIPLDHLKEALGEQLIDTLGFLPDVEIFLTDYNDALTEQQLERIKDIRENMKGNNNTIWGQLKEAKKENELLRNKLRVFQEALLKAKQ